MCPEAPACSKAGRTYEGPGVPPALALPYEVKGDFYRGFDQAIATVALRALKQSR